MAFKLKMIIKNLKWLKGLKLHQSPKLANKVQKWTKIEQNRKAKKYPPKKDQNCQKFKRPKKS